MLKIRRPRIHEPPARSAIRDPMIHQEGCRRRDPRHVHAHACINWFFLRISCSKCTCTCYLYVCFYTCTDLSILLYIYGWLKYWSPMRVIKTSKVLSISTLIAFLNYVLRRSYNAVHVVHTNMRLMDKGLTDKASNGAWKAKPFTPVGNLPRNMCKHGVLQYATVFRRELNCASCWRLAISLAANAAITASNKYVSQYLSSISYLFSDKG